MLRDEIQKPIKSASQSWALTKLIGLCVVSITDDLSELREEVYGNGVPGGMKYQLMLITNDLEDIKKQLAPKQDEGFKMFQKWFLDKILPPIIVFAITSFFQVSMFVIALMAAVVNGWITFGS